MYISPRQNHDPFENFLFEDMINESTLSNALLYLILGDLNARSSTWWEVTRLDVLFFILWSTFLAQHL